jgi:hypothetical protein
MARNHRERPSGAGQGNAASTTPTTITKKMTPRMNCIVDGLPLFSSLTPRRAHFPMKKRRDAVATAPAASRCGK